MTPDELEAAYHTLVAWTANGLPILECPAIQDFNRADLAALRAVFARDVRRARSVGHLLGNPS